MDHATLDDILTEKIDKDLLKDLDHYLEIVRKNSRALASSLKRCFENARKSERYMIVYELGIKDRTDAPMGHLTLDDKDIEKYLENHLKDYFEKNDFMHYREFVRLLRACTIDLGGEVSSHIKEMYNNFFLGKRLVEAYRLGKI
jgi:hypothetical protein